jgi:hypothetical protein
MRTAYLTRPSARLLRELTTLALVLSFSHLSVVGDSCKPCFANRRPTPQVDTQEPKDWWKGPYETFQEAYDAALDDDSGDEVYEPGAENWGVRLYSSAAVPGYYYGFLYSDGGFPTVEELDCTTVDDVDTEDEKHTPGKPKTDNPSDEQTSCSTCGPGAGSSPLKNDDFQKYKEQMGFGRGSDGMPLGLLTYANDFLTTPEPTLEWSQFEVTEYSVGSLTQQLGADSRPITISSEP